MDEVLRQQADIGGQAEFYLGTVVAWSNSTGVQIRLDGQDSAMTKRYKMLMMSQPPPKVGARVVVMKQSGTYIVMGEIGNPNADVFYSSTLSTFLTASEAFNATGGSIVVSGRVAEIYVNGIWTRTVSSTSAETTAFTLKSGYRPRITTAARAWRNANAILYYSGEMKFTGAFTEGGGATFMATYIIA